MVFTFLLGAASMGYLLLYRYRLLELAQALKNAGQSRESAAGRRSVPGGPELALVIHLLALVAFVALAWTMVRLLFFR